MVLWIPTIPSSFQRNGWNGVVAYIPEILGEKRQNVQCMCVCVCVCVFGELRVLEGKET